MRTSQGQGEILSAHLTAEEAVNSVERVRELVNPYFDQLDELLRDPLLSAPPNSSPEKIQIFKFYMNEECF